MTSEYPNKMREIISKYIKDQDITQTTFANRLTVHGPTTLGRLMQGMAEKLYLEHVIDYAQAMHISTRQLLVMLGAIESMESEELQPDLYELNSIIKDWPAQDKRTILAKIKEISEIAQKWAGLRIDI